MALLYLAVDGGGSSTEFFLADGDGQKVDSFLVGSTSKKSIGASGAQANIKQGVEKLVQILGSLDASLSDVRGVWGLSGCDSPADQAEYEQMLVHAGLDLDLHRVMNDSLLALRACTENQGIIVISGTGSVAVGVRDDGETYRIGGWGYQVSDLGSGTWVGSQLLREALLFDDGCRPFDPVFDLVYQQAGCKRGELGPRVATMTGANQIAAFARMAMESQDSPVCLETIQCAAGYLAEYVCSVASHLFEGQEFDVVLAGGLFKSDDFAGTVSRMVQAGAGVPEQRIHRLDVSPVLGGIRMAISGQKTR